MTQSEQDRLRKLRKLAYERHKARLRDPSIPPPRKTRTPKPPRKIIHQMVCKCRAMPESPHAFRYAKKIVRKMIEFGLLIRPKKCQKCNHSDRGIIEIYHEHHRRPRHVKFYCRECRCGIETAKAQALHLKRCGVFELVPGTQQPAQSKPA